MKAVLLIASMIISTATMARTMKSEWALVLESPTDLRIDVIHEESFAEVLDYKCIVYPTNDKAVRIKDGKMSEIDVKKAVCTKDNAIFEISTKCLEDNHQGHSTFEVVQEANQGTNNLYLSCI